MKNVIITGATGMIGGSVLDMCLESQEIVKVTSIVRRATGKIHEKLNEVIHKDFLDYSSIENHFENQDICYFCIGVYTGAVPRDKFREITVDYTKVFAELLRQKNEKTSFCFLSGQGADTTEKSRVAFAKDKGIAENILKELDFANLHIFPPRLYLSGKSQKRAQLHLFDDACSLQTNIGYLSKYWFDVCTISDGHI